MTNQIIQQLKLDQKWKAIISLILGLISLISGKEVIYIYATYKGVGDWILLIYFTIPILGIILGKMGLKSTKKGLAVVGIVLSVVGLLGTIIFYLFIKGMAESM